MTDRDIRKLVEDVANIVALKTIQPIEKRLTTIEARMCTEKEYGARVWKIVGVCFSIPSFIIAVFNLVSSL